MSRSIPFATCASPRAASSRTAGTECWFDYDQCIGCRSCMEACPYGARTYHAKRATYYGDGKTPYEEIQQEFPEGIVMKCNFCVDRVEQGLDPACVQTCPTECRVFGDLDDPESQVSRIIAEKKARPLLAEKGLEPSVFYMGS